MQLANQLDKFKYIKVQRACFARPQMILKLTSLKTVLCELEKCINTEQVCHFQQYTQPCKATHYSLLMCVVPCVECLAGANESIKQACQMTIFAKKRVAFFSNSY